MKTICVVLSLLCYGTAMMAQSHRLDNGGKQMEDSTDVFYRHLQLNEVMVSGDRQGTAGNGLDERD